MELLVLIPALLIFLFHLYKLTGDDHVFIRKSISIEQMFDIAFSTLWISLIVSRVYYYVIDPKVNGNFFVQFFTTAGGLSLAGAMLSGIIVLFVISKYKKIPLGRLFDFFTLSLLFALPAGYAGIALLHIKDAMLIPFLVCAVLYLAAAILFKKFLYPRLLNRTLKEGSISIYFFFLFALISFATTFVNFGKPTFSYVNITNLIYFSIFILGLVFLIKLERNKLRRRSA